MMLCEEEQGAYDIFIVNQINVAVNKIMICMSNNSNHNNHRML